MSILIIAEKPSAAEKIANALTEDKVEKINYKENAYYFKINLNGKEANVVPAVGHLFGLKQNVKGSSYPIFDVKWEPTFKISKKNEYAKKYYDMFKIFESKVNELYVATDYDTEGSVIGSNIVKFIFKKENAKRMKFSTLTKEELREAFEKASNSLDFGQINAGLTRHYLDWYYGINLSRALTDAIKSTGKVFSVISIGRVQGPMLNFLAKREEEIKKFKPTPFWELILKFKIGKKEYEALFHEKQIWEEDKANKILKEISLEKEAIIEKIVKKESEKAPPVPFNLTALQTEAYNLFGYSPKQTLDIAQSLYTSAYISYPRTSSQKLPKQLNLKKIISKLKSQKEYEKIANELLDKKDLTPNEGKKTDPAHPAIHPTGEIPKNLKPVQKKIYDLIVRRFLSCFGEPAKRESLRIDLKVNEYIFKISGSRTLSEGWIRIYKPYAKFQEVTFPSLNKGDKVNIVKVIKNSKETQPPSRYSQGSIIKELEKINLGTKATRAAILQTLYDRGYIVNKSIKVTDFGMALIKALRENIPEIVSVDLTRKFENEMEKIYEGKQEMDKTLDEAKKILTKVLNNFDKKKLKIGKILDNALIKTREDERTLGICPNCKEGKLKIFFSPRTKKRFVGCTNYPKCKTGYPLPLKGLIKKTNKVCDKCGTPIIYVYRKGKRPFKMCLDPNCPTKENWKKSK